jgi:hypothetical protein
MEGLGGATVRDGRGRFRPGQSGNPAGKKPGTLNEATMLRAALREGDEKAAARAVIDKAIGGNLAAARILLDRLDPKPRGRAIPLLMPEPGAVYDPARALAVLDAAFEAMAEGEISPEEALMVARAVKAQREERAAVAAALEATAPRPAAPAPRPAVVAAVAPVVEPVTAPVVGPVVPPVAAKATAPAPARRPSASAGAAPHLHSACISGQPAAPPALASLALGRAGRTAAPAPQGVSG